MKPDSIPKIHTREMSMKRTLSLTIGSALLAGLANTTAQAGENPFVMQELSSGYQLSQANAVAINVVPTAKAKDGKCGENKCGEGKCGVKK